MKKKAVYDFEATEPIGYVENVSITPLGLEVQFCLNEFGKKYLKGLGYRALKSRRFSDAEKARIRGLIASLQPSLPKDGLESSVRSNDPRRTRKGRRPRGQNTQQLFPQ